jgi:hypothetical protein
MNNVNNHNKDNTSKRKFQKVLISMTFLGSLLLMCNPSLASGLSVSSIGNVKIASTTMKYNDYQANQYWSQDMLWAIDKGLIAGYINSKHPTNPNIKTIGNWINPQGNLTEAQMLAVLFRYALPTELAQIIPSDAKWWASTSYQLAARYNVPTKGSLTNRAASNTIMTRGNLAQTLATLYFGKQVSIPTAVQFMYDANLSTGLPSKDGTFAKSYNSYGVADQLKRAHIVSFVKRYDNFKKSGKEIVESTPKQVVNGITVQFGKHTYASKNQTEYNKVMSSVTTGMANYKNLLLSNEPKLEPFFQLFLDGERASNATIGSLEEWGLSDAEDALGALDKNGVSDSVALNVYRARLGALNLLESVNPRTLNDTTPISAYDHLFNLVTDCDAYAQTISAAMDKAGYVTAIISKPGHAEVIVKVDNNWYLTIGTSFTDLSLSSLTQKGYKVTVAPTDGSSVY